MRINSYSYPKSSFLSLEKDMNIIVDLILKNDRLKKLLHYTTNDCLDKPDLTDEQSADLFGKEIKINNIIIIFTFAHNFEKIPALEMMKDKNGIFYKILGDIDKYPYFAFNNGDYFCNDLDYLRNTNAKNRNSFRSLLEYIISLKSISLKSDK